MFRFDPILILFIFSALIESILVWSAWQRRGRAPARYFAFFMLGPLLWNVFFIFEIAATDLNLKLNLANIQFIGIDVIPIGLLGLLLAYTGQVNKQKYWLLAALAFPLLNQLLIWTNPWHHFFRVNPHLDTTSTSFPILVNNYGLGFYLFQVPFTYLFIFFCLWLMFRTLRQAKGAYRQQILVLIFGTILPLLVDLLYTLGFSLIPNFNLTSVAFSISGLLFFWSLRHYRFLEVMPVARGKLIETLRDPWLVLDLQGRLVDMSPVAEDLIEKSSTEALGWSYTQVLAEFPALVKYLQETNSTYTSAEINIDKYGLRYTYEVRLFPLKDRRAKLTGKLLLMQDITRRKQLEEEREQTQQALREGEELFSTFMKNLPVPAYIRDDAHGQLYVNAAFERIFGEGWSNQLSGQPSSLLHNPQNDLLVGQPDSRLLNQDIARVIYQENLHPAPTGEHANGEAQIVEQEITDIHGVRRIMNVTLFPFLRQGKLDRIGGFVHDISELKNIQKRLENKSSEMERLANIDSLSGLYNRRYFDRAFANEVTLAGISGSSLAIGILDIDHFKQINDTFGHAQGDQVIIEIARLILGAVRSTDIVGRFGGEEFVLLFPDTPLEDACNVMERLRLIVEKHPGTALLNVTISGGVTAWERGDTPEDALKRADGLLYQAKETGRNNINSK